MLARTSAASAFIDVVDEELELDRLSGGLNQRQAAVEGGGALVEMRERMRLGGMRLEALLDPGVLAHDPFEDREADRKQEVDGEDARDRAEDNLLQKPRQPHGTS